MVDPFRKMITLREKLIKIGAKVVRCGRHITFQLGEVAIPRSLLANILRLNEDTDRRMLHRYVHTNVIFHCCPPLLAMPRSQTISNLATSKIGEQHLKPSVRVNRDYAS